MARATIQLGSSGADVLSLQNTLNAIGFSVPVDGSFSAETDAAVRSFQASHKLISNGIVDSSVWAALGVDGASNASSPYVTYIGLGLAAFLLYKALYN